MYDMHRKKRQSLPGEPYKSEVIAARLSPALLHKLDQQVDGVRIYSLSDAVRCAIACSPIGATAKR